MSLLFLQMSIVSIAQMYENLFSQLPNGHLGGFGSFAIITRYNKKPYKYSISDMYYYIYRINSRSRNAGQRPWTSVTLIRYFFINFHRHFVSLHSHHQCIKFSFPYTLPKTVCHLTVHMYKNHLFNFLMEIYYIIY